MGSRYNNSKIDWWIPTVIKALLIIMLCGCTSHDKYADLQKSIDEFVERKDANIGVAVIIDRKDTVAVNGDKEFPMLSVYKFPITLALVDEYLQKKMSFDYPITILPEDLHPDTWSPMTEKILSSSQLSTDTLKIPTRELLRYMLHQSDNNASDIMLKFLGGPNRVNFTGVNVSTTEDEMHLDNALCYVNSATPIAMTSLLDKFDKDYNDSLSCEIKQMMESCSTGFDRLVKPLVMTSAVIGHKTGTGFTMPDGRLMAVNDAGYVHLPNGHCYTITVFVENSGYDMAKTESLIAEISKIVYDGISNQYK